MIETAQSIILYILLFVSVYFQMFILYVYFTNRKKLDNEHKTVVKLTIYPSVTVVIPCYNEEKTVGKTIDSVMSLDYPKDKLRMSVVDDGSKDNTWQIVQEYKKKYPNIDIFHKENGGKHTAMNFAIERCKTDFIGSLDADSFVSKDSLTKLIAKFSDPKVMAVTPAMKIYNPSTMIQIMQSIEYTFGILFKKVMGILGAIYVTPGPFSIFRREVFDKIGMFRPAHNTEDMEMACRIQANHFKIENVHDAYVYTTGPNTVKKLYHQRVRWTYGFLQNIKDYRYMIFNKDYGNIGLFVLPIALLLTSSILFFLGFAVYEGIMFVIHKYFEWRAVGLLYPQWHWNVFFLSARTHMFLIVFIYTIMTIIIFCAQKLSKEKVGFTWPMVLYFTIYPIISTCWVVKSFYNVALSKKTSWR